MTVDIDIDISKNSVKTVILPSKVIKKNFFFSESGAKYTVRESFFATPNILIILNILNTLQKHSPT